MPVASDMHPNGTKRQCCHTCGRRVVTSKTHMAITDVLPSPEVYDSIPGPVKDLSAVFFVSKSEISFSISNFGCSTRPVPHLADTAGFDQRGKKTTTSQGKMHAMFRLAEPLVHRTRKKEIILR